MISNRSERHQNAALVPGWNDTVFNSIQIFRDTGPDNLPRDAVRS